MLTQIAGRAKSDCPGVLSSGFSMPVFDPVTYSDWTRTSKICKPHPHHPPTGISGNSTPGVGAGEETAFIDPGNGAAFGYWRGFSRIRIDRAECRDEAEIDWMVWGGGGGQLGIYRAVCIIRLQH